LSHGLAAAASALVGKLVEALDAQEAACGASPDVARWWADPAHDEQRQLQLEPLDTLAMKLVIVQRLLCIDIPAQAQKTLKKGDASDKT